MITRRIVLLLVAYAAATSPASAYLDPGTGSMILQGIAAVVATGAGAVAVFWDRVRAFFDKKPKTADADDDDDNN